MIEIYVNNIGKNPKHTPLQALWVVQDYFLDHHMNIGGIWCATTKGGSYVKDVLYDEWTNRYITTNPDKKKYKGNVVHYYKDLVG